MWTEKPIDSITSATFSTIHNTYYYRYRFELELLKKQRKNNCAYPSRT